MAALKLNRAGTDKSQLTPEEIVQEVKNFWENGGNEHFREEEEIVLPIFAQFADVDIPEIKENLIEHVKIRSLVNQVLKTTPPSIDQMHQLGQLLEAHVRKEERTLFPMIEDTLPDEKLYELEPFLHINIREKDNEEG